MRILISVACILLFFSCQEESPKTVFEDMFNDGSAVFKNVIQEKEKYEIQILFSPITRLGDSVIIEDHFFNYRPGEYFYPASTVKMPVVFMALQKMEELRSSGININRNTRVHIDSIGPSQSSVLWDSTQIKHRPTIAHYIDKVFSVNDNDAYNRLFEFCSLDYINAGLRAKGIFTNSRIVHRLGVPGLSLEDNKHTPPIHFLDDQGNIIYTNANTVAQGYHLTLVDNTRKGVAFLDENNDKVNQPFDFSEKNFININDLQESLKRFVFPELYFPQQRYNIGREDREYVFESMTKLSQDYHYLGGKTEEYYDSFVKFFLFDDSIESIPDHIKIRNKAGFAYGYMTDCAYIQDEKEGIEYFLTATIHVNENETYNDGIYEYDKIGMPFLSELGRLAHNYMIENK